MIGDFQQKCLNGCRMQRSLMNAKLVETQNNARANVNNFQVIAVDNNNMTIIFQSSKKSKNDGY